MKPILLKDHGIRLFYGRLYNHDYLWFSSSEIAQVSNTWPLLHNYALTYALSQYSYGIYLGTAPQYEHDLKVMPVYATPAINTRVKRVEVTLNAMDDLTLRTDTGGKINTPSLAKRIVISPQVAKTKGHRRETFGYSFYCFTLTDYKLPGTFRLGKKGCSVRVYWEEIGGAEAYFIKNPVIPDHPVNPLDIYGSIIWYEPTIMPPHMIFRRVQIQNDYFISVGKNMILFPKRLWQGR
ncbi:type I-D CRISPR-associated protein Cas5/Csc1 [Desulfitibacter alkalitolerans]|uniref:type I-D CRISPR-associated protein Cas5/Csc1 n=1 Tax=Desulfitibacter alkalitolerans TaxID=264641 RepID=UPI00146FBA16|nr:type I-D CRISPR-associated protein Cas5/Csc1 [Desulfitibacter alkalitolerans]